MNRVGVLLVNIGTPDATDYWSIRRYLKEFLSDPRVIETNRVTWWFVLNFVVLTTRPQRKGRDYDKIWNREKNESPLKTITRSQAEKLGRKLGKSVVVDWAMRYGNPSIPAGLDFLLSRGCERLLIVPLYPQYAAASTASVSDKIFQSLAKMRRLPAVRFAPCWYDDAVYIEALAASIKAALGKLSWKPEVILASFHGIPKDYVEKGDPYAEQCAATARLLRARLKFDERKFRVSFQSRFGRAEWLQPYTDEAVRTLAQAGVKKLAVVTPGFVADCLETLEEIAGGSAEIFHHHGGKKFFAVPCLNDSSLGMRVIEQVVKRELAGWV
jgi:ferrochelatase